MEIILILGAGVSKDFGIPITSELIDSFPEDAIDGPDEFLEFARNCTKERY